MTKALRACVFPGQGSQCVGMGQDLAAHFKEARYVFEEVDETLGYKLSEMMFEGPDDRLRQTQHAQPALMAVSMAVVRTLEANGVSISSFAMAAGHSLGEFSALCAAGVLTLSETARLLDIRGRAMQEAVPEGGAMAAVIGLAEDQVARIPVSDSGAVCVIANDNCRGQVVLSGHGQAVAEAGVWVKDQGARFMPLKVSGPFHSPLMAPAADTLKEALEAISFKAPHIPIITNVSAQPQTDPLVLKDHLTQQVTGRVRWRETMETLATSGIQNVVEMGSGRVLSGLMKRQHPEIETLALSDHACLTAFLD
jgi:[acyl-carrier-protein] S-malonyltransferase